MEYALIIWTVVGMAGTNLSVSHRYDWRPIATFSSTATVNAIDLCKAAALQLNIKDTNYRCVKTK
jgi:hypothetical protein